MGRSGPYCRETGIFGLKRKLTLAGNGFLEGAYSGEELESSWAYRVLGLRATAGLQIGRYMVAEARYLDAGVLDGVPFRGYTFALGVHF